VGSTPLDTRIARASSPVDVVLRRPGFAPLTTRVLPDVDQRLVLTLRAAASPAPRARPAPTPSIEKLP
jgi:hypothetical protein